MSQHLPLPAQHRVCRGRAGVGVSLLLLAAVNRDAMRRRHWLQSQSVPPPGCVVHGKPDSVQSLQKAAGRILSQRLLSAITSVVQTTVMALVATAPSLSKLLPQVETSSALHPSLLCVVPRPVNRVKPNARFCWSLTSIRRREHRGCETEERYHQRYLFGASFSKCSQGGVK